MGRPDHANGDSPPAQADRTITVDGSGSVAATPDQAAFSFGVTTQGETAAAALAANGTEMARVIDALRAAGIAAESIQTSSVSLSAVMSSQGDSIVGYTATNTVSVTIKGVVRSGAIVDAAVAAGANQVDGPSLTVADQGELYRSALKAAVTDARAKAQALAEAAGLKLGAVRSVAEAGGSAPPVPYAAAMRSTSETPVEPGAQEVAATATVVFAVS